MKEKNPKQEDVISKLSPKDFDGHTEFDRMSPKQRLQWLSKMAAFLWKARKAQKNS